ncbi:molybdopterin molybdenumtransferase MoeA [Streptomyces carminius]|uniref:Molybdopterin molybdenumtransferase n=1 Tax=Streptomyces carminius TaxID=2665496 RepID=A0A2M8M0I9_9ACTN|nr:gephyrin-like molybdotransferase Glp [Streptomyces carminius]PJE97013.1 molybdopterin molybdenumtransferase MoeA [Streptomyces carminius]PJE97722.1 molybdopterin molybdenumtransferase MoeA [Streptomyces carminius]
MSETWSVDEHLADILRSVRPLEPIELQLLDAQGCVLVEDVLVPVSLPPFDNSSMDGYAVRVADVAGASEDDPAVLRVVGDVAAGTGRAPEVGPGQAARVMTGAPLPPGAEAVVPVEWTDGGTGGGPAEAMAAHRADPSGAGGGVRVHRPAEARQYVRDKGSDVRAGSVALTAGTVLGPAQIGLLAAIGQGTVTVRPRPRVVVLSTGSELVPPGSPLGHGQIHDSNSFALTAAARAAGAIAYRVGAVADDAPALREVIEDQLVRADAVVTSGGVSVGAYDVVKEALSDLAGTALGGAEPVRPGDEHEHGDGDSAEPAATAAATDAAEGSEAASAPARTPARGVEFRRLAMQPGKPQGFGLVGPDGTPLFALPGNPVSSYVSFELFVRPALRTLMGLEPVSRPTVRARVECDGPLTSPDGKRQFLRGRYTPPAPGEKTGTVRPAGGAGSHLTASLARADALIVVPEQTTGVARGDELEVVLLE